MDTQLETTTDRISEESICSNSFQNDYCELKLCDLSSSSQLKIMETHDEILDLRRYSPGSLIKLKKAQTDNTVVTNRFVQKSKLVRYSNNHRIARNVSISKNNKDFDTATEMIAERILNKQIELEKNKNESCIKATISRKSRITPLKINKIIAHRIFHTQNVVVKDGSKINNVSTTNDRYSDDNSSLSNVSEFSKVSSQSTNSIFKHSKLPKPRCRQRFFVNANNVKKRLVASDKKTQADLEKLYHTPTVTQTSFSEFNRDCTTQAELKSRTNEKKMQTRLYKTMENETIPILFEGPCKYTNTDVRYPQTDEYTQNYEYLSESDLFCLDWVNKHLISFTIDSHNIVLDEKVKDISEICTKSSMFTAITFNDLL